MNAPLKLYGNNRPSILLFPGHILYDFVPYFGPSQILSLTEIINISL